nr:MAG: hypothetical protein DIU68_18095 [Chloroflexota bacterium]
MTRNFPSLILALGLTIAAVLFTTLPGNSGIVAGTSKALGGSDITDAIGHAVLFTALTVAWQRALTAYVGRRTAILIAVIAMLLFGAITEIAQAGIPERGASVLDLGANALGVALASLYIRARNR